LYWLVLAATPQVPQVMEILKKSRKLFPQLQNSEKTVGILKTRKAVFIEKVMKDILNNVQAKLSLLILS